MRTVCTTFTYFVFRFVTISRCRRRMIFSFHMVKQYFNFFDSFDFFLYAATNWCLRRIAVVCPNQVVIFSNKSVYWYHIKIYHTMHFLYILLFFLMRVCVCVCFGIKEREREVVIRTSRAGKRELVVVYKRSSLLYYLRIKKCIII